MNALPQDGSPIDAAFLRRWLTTATEAVERESSHLTELDSPIGDADHGTNMRRGFVAARTTVEQEPPDTPGGVLVAIGRQLISSVGGASGPLYGTLLRRAGKALGDDEGCVPTVPIRVDAGRLYLLREAVVPAAVKPVTEKAA